MFLKQLIEALSKEDPAKVLPLGFNAPHSYRGYYEDLAFEPARNISVGDMLNAATSALGQTFQGYKGGDYTMSEYTTCWLANYGETGESIGPYLLRFMLSSASSRIAGQEKKE